MVVHEWLSVVTGLSGAICISSTVAADLAAWMENHQPEHLTQFRINWFHLGADIDNSKPSLGVPHNANLVLAKLNARPSFLMVGTLEPRKGHAQVLEAFDLLWRSGVDINLVIVGKQGWLVDALVQQLHNHPELNTRLFWLEGISDEYLEQVYAASTCLVAASYGEGFGLPLIEAAQYKLPIFARDIPVFREVAGEHAHYFNAEGPTELAHAMEQWLALHKANRHPKSDNMPWLTWKDSAAQLLQVLKLPVQIESTPNKVKVNY
jgi:glycosyltransferase involved in cell wall biosynthesis